MFQRILVGLDGSEAGTAAASLAGWIAVHLGVSVQLVSVIEEPPPYVSVRSEERSERLGAEAYFRDVQRAALSRLRRRGVQVDAAIRTGNEAAGLLAAAEALDVDLIVIGHAGHSGVWGTGLGATAGRVVEGSSASVAVVRPDGGDVARIAVAYDGSADARRAVEVGASLASAASLDLEVAASPEALEEGDRRWGIRALRERSGGGNDWTLTTIDGEPAAGISAVARRGAHALLIVGAHGRRHPWAQGLGPVARSVVERAPTSVMVVRPPSGRLTARRLMRSSPVGVTPETTIADAAGLVLRLGIKCLPVLDRANHPVGVLTLGDLLRRSALRMRHGLAQAMGDDALRHELERLAATRVTCADVMSSPAVTVDPEAPLAELLRVMRDRSVKRVLIVGADGVLLGIVSRSDVLRALAGAAVGPDVATRRAVSGRVAGDVMVIGVPTIAPDTPGEEVARAVLGSGVGRVAVVDAERRLVGVVATRDLLPLAGDAPGHVSIAAFGGMAGRLEVLLADHRPGAAPGPTAADLMRRDVVAVQTETSLAIVVQLMMARGLKRVLVTDDHGAPIGVIDRADVIRTLTDTIGLTTGDGLTRASS